MIHIILYSSNSDDNDDNNRFGNIFGKHEINNRYTSHLLLTSTADIHSPINCLLRFNKGKIAGSIPATATNEGCRRANRMDRGFGTKPYTIIIVDLWNRMSSARYGEIVHLGRAAQMADGHWTVNPAHRNAGGSNPSSPTTNDIVMVEGKSTTENSTKSHRGQLRLFLNLKSPGNPLALSIPKLTWKQQPARSRDCLLSRSFAYCELRSELSVSA